MANVGVVISRCFADVGCLGCLGEGGGGIWCLTCIVLKAVIALCWVLLSLSHPVLMWVTNNRRDICPGAVLCPDEVHWLAST